MDWTEFTVARGDASEGQLIRVRVDWIGVWLAVPFAVAIGDCP